mmetsp:Transcript_17399/g.29484  ORF Transcript_17399/g.29484 Transcript_17399/m.29484 type:complete len:80 (+) Transcript_17399:2037-2276(+)
MRVRTAQRIGFEARDTQEEDIIFVLFVQSFLLLGLKGRAYKDYIDISIMLIDDRLEWAKLDQVCVGGMHQRRTVDALAC